MPAPALTIAAATLAAVAAAAPSDASLPYIGCYKEVSRGVRWPLEVYVLNWQKSPASPEACKTACHQYTTPLPPIFGINSYSCFCGYNTFDNLRLVPDSNCNETCNGNNQATCGQLTENGQFLSLYGDAKALPPPAYLPGLTEETCYFATEELTGPSYKDDEAMTVNSCAEFCVGKHSMNHIYLASDNTCHCSEEQILTKKAPFQPCDVTCSGDPKQKCGGGKDPRNDQFISSWVFA